MIILPWKLSEKRSTQTGFELASSEWPNHCLCQLSYRVNCEQQWVQSYLNQKEILATAEHLYEKVLCSNAISKWSILG